MSNSLRLRIEDALAYLCRSNVGNFYAMTVNSLERVYTTSVPVMAVSQRGTKYVLLVNPEFTEEMSFEEILLVLEHEVLHVVLSHVPRKLDVLRRLETEREKLFFLMADGVAVDYAVNSLLVKHHRPEVFENMDAYLPEKYDLPRGLTYEEYLARMMKIYADIIPEPERFVKATVDALRAKVDELGGMEPDSVLGEIYQAVNKELGVPTSLDEALLFAEVTRTELPNGDVLVDLVLSEERLEALPEGEQKKYAELKGKIAAQHEMARVRLLEEMNVEVVDDPAAIHMSRAQMKARKEENTVYGVPFDALTPRQRMVFQAKHDIVKGIKDHLADLLSKGANDPATAKHLDEHGKSIVRRVLRGLSDKGRGTLAGEILELIQAFLRPPAVSWRELLRAFVARTLKSKPKRGMRRISKPRAALRLRLAAQMDALSRLPLFPGSERDNTYWIYYVLDTSGSMSAADLQAGLSELQHIQRVTDNVRITVLYVDAGVGKEYEIDSNSQIDYEITGRGGTDFETAFAHIKASGARPDVVIYATDGYAPRPATRLNCPTIWLLTPHGASVMEGVPGNITLQMRDYALGEAA